MKRLTIALLAALLLIGSVPAAAQWESYGTVTDVTAIAWLEGGTLSVALANSSNTRTTVTVSTNTVDSWGRPVFASRQVSIPGCTIVLETFYPGTYWRGELDVRVSGGFRGFKVPVQNGDIFQPDSYIVAANTQLNVRVNLDNLLDSSGQTRLVVDDYYTTQGGAQDDRIRIESIGGGLTQVRGTNTIEYVKPYMVLRMKTPNIAGLTTLTFGMRKSEGPSNWWQERIEGPTILVYGRNMRFLGTSSYDDNSGRVAR